MPTGAKPSLFSEFALQWLATRAVVELKASAFREYETIVRLHLIPEFGHIPLSELAPLRIQEWIAASIASGASPRTVRNRVIVLRRILDTAVDYGVLSRNVARLVGSIHLEPRDRKYLSPEQIRLLLDSTPPSWRLLLALPALCGLRKSECLALEFDDISPGSMNIRITKSLRGGVVTSTKTSQSVRNVGMSDRLAAILLEHKVNAPYSPYDLVFPTPEGTPRDGANLHKRVFQPMLRRSGLARIRIHDLRHTFASVLINSGENLKYVQMQLGHSSIKTTVDRYGHLMPDAHKNAGSRLDAALFGDTAQILDDKLLTSTPEKQQVRDSVSP